MNKLSSTPAWQALTKHNAEFQSEESSLAKLFAADPEREQNLSIQLDGLLLDYSRNHVNNQTLQLLQQLAEQSELPAAIEAMFNGEPINNSEHRPALHVALREPTGQQSRPEVGATLQRMEEFVDAVYNGDWLGFSGKRITDVVNIGIGGSDLGPNMVTEALGQFNQGKLACHFVSNVDPAHIESVLENLHPDNTLFVIASKSFTTLETHQNANAARAWFLEKTGNESAIASHFTAISSNLDAVKKFGINENNIFPMWDWVGGRYSLWSAIGLPIALSIGMDNFRQLLAGAHAMDKHFRTAPLNQNMPVILGLLGIWYQCFMGGNSTAVVPYLQRLQQLPAYLQQLCMESLGKRVDKSGNALDVDTGDVIWGTAGTNGQHSYFQLLHQGTRLIPVDFIASANPSADGGNEQHAQLLANCLSQAMALMQGEANPDAPHKHFEGNKPSNTILLRELNPHNLGALLALYEHKVYVQSTIWGINAFDQWGVELGKKLSSQVFDAMRKDAGDFTQDRATARLISLIKQWQKNES